MAPASKTVFVCQQCAYKSPKWIGRCPSCNTWNSFVEEVVEKKGKANALAISVPESEIFEIGDIDVTESERIQLPYDEFNRVLGGGLVKGSLVLLGGEPGIGKSTLVLQSVLALYQKRILYVSGEESPSQIKLRANRLNSNAAKVYLYSGTSIDHIIEAARNTSPDVLVVDSVQTVYTDEISSVPGSVSQVRACAQLLQKFAKTTGVPVIIIGHINKEGSIAGPMSLEHIVDVVLQFEGDTNNYYRLLRSKKNRFGSAFELGVFEMTQQGLSEISDPGNLLLTGRDEDVGGVAVTAMNEGSRSLMLEIQALAGNSVYSSPQRTATGFDSRRLNMILAVIEKRLGYRLGQKDIFLNIAGGIKLNDPAADLAVLAALLSSLTDMPVTGNTCFLGEISLTGQIRPVANFQLRISEITKLRFNRLFVSKYQKIESITSQIEIIPVAGIQQFAKQVFR